MFAKQIDLTPPSKKQLYEFRKLVGLAHLLEEVPSDAEEIDVTKDQMDPEKQIDPDDASDRDKKEDEVRQVKGYDGKVVWDGKKPGPKQKKK